MAKSSFCTKMPKLSQCLDMRMSKRRPFRHSLFVCMPTWEKAQKHNAINLSGFKQTTIIFEYKHAISWILYSVVTGNIHCVSKKCNVFENCFFLLYTSKTMISYITKEFFSDFLKGTTPILWKFKGNNWRSSQSNTHTTR